MDGIHPPGFEEEYLKKSWFSSIYEWIRRRTHTVTVTANYTVAEDVWLVEADASGGALTVTIPLSANRRGRQIAVVKTDTSFNVVTIARSGTDTLNTATSLVLSGQHHSVTLGANGKTLWYIISSRYPPS